MLHVSSSFKTSSSWHYTRKIPFRIFFIFTKQGSLSTFTPNQEMRNFMYARWYSQLIFIFFQCVYIYTNWKYTLYTGSKNKFSKYKKKSWNIRLLCVRKDFLWNFKIDERHIDFLLKWRDEIAEYYGWLLLRE